MIRKKSIYLFIILGAIIMSGCNTNKGNSNSKIGDSTNQTTGNGSSQNVDSKKQVAENGQKVAVDYIGKLEDGTIFDTSIESAAKQNGNFMTGRNYKPLEFTLGAGQMIQGFDKGIVGMKIGETKEIKIPPQEGYGNPSPEMVKDIPLKEFSGFDFKEGQEYNFGGYNGKVLKLTSDTVTIDFNHKLAGKTLIFEVTLKEIK